jgi:hypothetical protein
MDCNIEVALAVSRTSEDIMRTFLFPSLVALLATEAFAQNKTDTAFAAFTKCVASQAARLAPLHEPMKDTAEVALANCRDDELALATAWEERSESLAASVMRTHLDNARADALIIIADERLKRGQ